MKYWVYTVVDPGGGSAPPLEWLLKWPHHIREMWFPRSKRPTAISPGDRAVIYGARQRGFIAAVEVTSEGVVDATELDDDDYEWSRERFPYLMRHRLLVAKVADGNVASAESAGISPRRIQRGPHTEIQQEEYERAVAGLLEAAARTAIEHARP